MNRRPRVLLVATHPVQYSSPIFRLMAKDPRVDIKVAYCSMQGAESQLDPGFGIEVKWDTPLLDGYPWEYVPNRSPVPKGGSFLRFFNPGIWRMISRSYFDAVVLYTGYVSATFWIALAAAKWCRVPVLFGTDAHELAPRDSKKWKVSVKRLLWPRLFRLADVVIAPSSATVALMLSLGIPADNVVLTPYCVDNQWWLEQSRKVNRLAVRARWDVPDHAIVVLFCAKLQPWKRPQDLLRAFAQVANPDTYLVFAGEGPQRAALEFEAKSLRIAERTRFLGFVNQSELPNVYTSSDIFVLPSESEPFGVVVNEAMLCGCPVIVSDRVGAGFDLVREGETGFVFPAGNVTSLASVLRRALGDRQHLHEMGEEARGRMVHWSPADNIAGFLRSITAATRITSKRQLPDSREPV
jgi:glycosyltransferase involved in cell wall biosynthesis